MGLPDWITFPAGLYGQGHDGNGFAFDNETPRHQVWQPAFQLASRLITNGEYLAFIEAGGYERPEFWLADGWEACGGQRWQAVLTLYRSFADPGTYYAFIDLTKLPQTK